VSVLVDKANASGTLLVVEATLRADGMATALAESRVVTTVNQSSPLAVSLKASPNPVRPGEMVIWTVTVANRGALALSGVEVTALVPDWLDSTFNDASGLSAGGTCPGGGCDMGETAHWIVGSLAAGQSRIVTMSTKVSSAFNPPPDGSLIQSVAIARDSDYRATDTCTVVVAKMP
jgi:uncharacterized repeat protein (TIGR01451 family)